MENNMMLTIFLTFALIWVLLVPIVVTCTMIFYVLTKILTTKISHIIKIRILNGWNLLLEIIQKSEYILLKLSLKIIKIGK